MKKYSKSQLQQMGLNENLPAHVAIIMDGNGRWAVNKGQLRVLGHRAGVDRLREIIKFSSDAGIAALSLYAFSTENWKRPNDEVSALCGLLVEYFNKEIDELHSNGVCIRALGDIGPFPPSVRGAVNKAVLKTVNNTGLKLNIALNYGGQNELLRAVKEIASSVKNGGLDIDDIDYECFEGKLDTAGLPPVDCLIRTGGEQRISNFLLYQVAYAEILFLETYWPDFTVDEYVGALVRFQGRKRRYGGL